MKLVPYSKQRGWSIPHQDWGMKWKPRIQCIEGEYTLTDPFLAWGCLSAEGKGRWAKAYDWCIRQNKKNSRQMTIGQWLDNTPHPWQVAGLLP